MKTTFSSIKKVFCVAAIFSVMGMSIFASPKPEEPKNETTISIPAEASLMTIRGKVKVSKKAGEQIVSYTSISNRNYSVVVVEPLTKEELIAIKNKKVYLSGYLDETTMTFYVTTIGHLPASDSSANAK